mmetsp:Transcript_2880/g.6273  ORF Transcript_2880/g.6273 Transcript_2880/m.6273 type:complete len:874 (-) Transcript_2880:77-2698(-)
MCECLMQLQAEKEDAATKDDEEGEGNNNLELMSLTYAISHLAEIFLLPSLASADGRSAYRSNADGGFYSSSSSSRLDGPSGSLTADTVRYLRLHHGKPLAGMPEVADMLESDQPEYWIGDGTNSSIPGPFDRPYWNLLLHLVVQGQLVEAWTVLSHHSACRHVEEEARQASLRGREHYLSPEGEGFAALQAILLSAPLPGGRGDGYCDDAGLDDYLEAELLEREEEDVEEEEDAESPPDMYQLLMDGVPPSAFLLWEALPRSSDRWRMLRYRRDLRRCGRRDDAAELETLDSTTLMPETYQSRVALNAFQTWQDTVRVTAFSGGAGGGTGGGVLEALFQRFPPLSQIMSILLGRVPPSISNYLTWSQVLLGELLYARPEVMPEDIAVRANEAMKKVGGDGRKQPLEDIVLSIMKGSAGQVVETMFGLCGGSSGAALPATMTSLLCNLLVDTGCITPQKDEVNIQTELLLLAADSILSSFSVQEQSDVGVRTTVRLLLPHAPAKKKRAVPLGATDDENVDDDIIYEPRIAATIAEALAHRKPATDAEARDLLDLCEECIRLGSVPISDACESLAFCRALHHNGHSNQGKSGNLTREVYWLLRGMEVQSCWLPEDRQKTLGFACRRRFDFLCENSANNLITLLSMAAISTNFSDKMVIERQEKETAVVLRVAEDVLEGVLQDEVMAPALKGHIEANLLKYSVDIALADAKGDTIQVATDIVHCLEERCLSDGEYGGVVSTLANPKVYVDFLRIAFAILAKEEANELGRPMEFAKCAFSIHGMHILMARLTQVLSWEGIISSSHRQTSSMLSKQQLPSDEKKDYFSAMRLAFSKGLMRAFVSNGPSSVVATKTIGNKIGGEMSLDEEIELMGLASR